MLVLLIAIPLVGKILSDSENNDNNLPETVSGSMTMVRKWGDGVCDAATEFFGEDVALQRRTPSPRRRGNVHQRLPEGYRLEIDATRNCADER